MPRDDYSEDLLIQAPTAELLEKQLGWKAVFDLAPFPKTLSSKG